MKINSANITCLNNNTFYEHNLSDPLLQKQSQTIEILKKIDCGTVFQQIHLDKVNKTKRVPELRFSKFSSNWKTYKLGDICNIVTGSKDVKDATVNGKYNFYIRSKNVLKINTYSHDGEAILLGGDGNILDLVHYAKGKFDFHQRVYKICTDKNFSLYYLYVYIKNFIGIELKKNSAKTTVDSVRKPTLLKFNINIPCICEQAQIGNFFKKLDDTISLHEQELGNLMKTKQGLLQKMFPKERERAPKLRFPGFNKDWNIYKLGNLGSTYTGLSGKTKIDFGHGDAKFITYVNVYANIIADTNGTECIEIDPKQNEVQFGDVLFTISSEVAEEVGMSSVWLENIPNVYLNSFCFGYRPFANINPVYLAFLLRAPEVRKKIILLAQGISRYNISKNKMMELYIPVPCYEEQTQIGNFFKKLDGTILLRKQQLENLKLMKKAFLQKMLI